MQRKILYMFFFIFLFSFTENISDGKKYIIKKISMLNKSFSNKSLGLKQNFWEACNEIKKNLPTVEALIVCSDREVLYEKYFNGFNSGKKFNIYSVTKSITATLIGILLKEKFIPSVDSPIKKYIQIIPEHRKNLTIKNLLTMSNGSNWDIKQMDEMFYRVTHISESVQQPTKFKAGKIFRYDDLNYCLLSLLIEKCAGMSEEKFAKKYLFQPLGIKNFFWEKAPDGYNFGGFGLYLSANDLKKIALLYMNFGKYNNKIIIDSIYIHNATTENISAGFPGTGGYGFGWWTGVSNGIKYSYALGYGGTFLFHCPEKKLSCIICSNNTLPLDEICKPLYIFESFILK